MQAGRLNHLIEIQSRSVAQDTVGEPIVSWSSLASVWAEITMRRGVERRAASSDQTVAGNAYTVRIYYRDDVSPLNRIVYDGRVLDITSAVDPYGSREMLEIECDERIGETP